MKGNVRTKARVGQSNRMMFAEFVERSASDHDWPGIWAVLEPSIRDGNWFTIPRDFTETQARAFWFAEAHDVFVCTDNREVLWTYYLCPIQLGGGAHVANAGYAVAHSRFGQGLGHSMVEHSLEIARQRGYRSMLYTAVLSTNKRAIRLYIKSGFATLTRVPEAYLHPSCGYIDTLIMHRALS